MFTYMHKCECISTAKRASNTQSHVFLQLQRSVVRSDGVSISLRVRIQQGERVVDSRRFSRFEGHSIKIARFSDACDTLKIIVGMIW